MIEKLKDKNLLFYLSIILACLCSVYAGLADLVYYWQRDLGEQIIKNFDFNYSRKQIWGTIGVSEYYDHEWLCNILFYLFSLIPYKPLFFLKFAISLVTGLSFVRFIKAENKEYSDLQKIEILLIILIYSSVLLKIKAYSISVIFFMEEIVLLKKYKNNPSKVYFLRLLLLCIFWNNFHSGSILLFFAVAGVYWIVYFRNIKVLVYGIICLLSTLINPYGYKLVLFNLSHNFNSVMKQVVQDWKPIDAKETYGVLIAIFLVVFFVNYIYSKKKNLEYLFLSFIFFFMSLGSARHIIYLIPLSIIIIGDSRIKKDLRYNYMPYVSFGLCILFLLNSYSVLANKDYDAIYAMDYVSDELANLLKETNKDSSDGLFNDVSFVYTCDYEAKNFVTGGFPLVESRCLDSSVLLRYASVTSIESIIDYYDLNKIVFSKWCADVEYYTLENPLYDYLNSSDKYVKLYDDDFLVYFVDRSLGYEVE